MAKAAEGNTVAVHYTGKLSDGTVFDSSREREPLKVELGKGEVIPGFEDALAGMEVGQTKTVEIPADQAYGERREELIQSVSRDELPDEVQVQVGDQLQARTQEGQLIMVRVESIEDDSVQLDANHPLAGKDLTFDLEVMEIA